METLGTKIYRQRKMKGLSQEELAYRMKVSRQTISKWETGLTKPTLENIKLLCIVLGVEIEYFIEKELTEEKPIETLIEGQSKDKYLTEAEAIEEISATVSKEKGKNSYKKLKIGIALISILLMLSIILTVIVGFTVLTTNIGDYNVNSQNIPKEGFVIALVVTIIIFFTLIWLVCKLKKKKKSNLC